jgi:hypothetical protein
MPKRRSLVGTAREAITDAAAPRPQGPPPPSKPPAKPPRAASKAKREAVQKPAPSPQSKPAALPPEAVTIAGPATAYEAVAGFASATLRQNLETSARLARCKSPMEALAAQAAHATAITQNFIAVSLKLMQLGLSPASSAPIRRPEPRLDTH